MNSMIFVLVCVGRLPRHPPCLEVFRGAYRVEMPFMNTSTVNNTQRGIIPIIFDKAIRTCCRGDYEIDFEREFKTQDEVLEIVKNYSLHFIMPIQKDVRSNKYLHNPFVSIGKCDNDKAIPNQIRQ